MSPLVFKTDPESTQGTVIAGVGTIPAGGLGGIPVEGAAAAMTELQAKDDNGVVKYDGDLPVPLQDKALEDAARKWAEANGLTVAEVEDDKLADLAAEAGLAPDPMTVEESAQQLGAYLYPEDGAEDSEPPLPPLEPVAAAPAAQAPSPQETAGLVTAPPPDAGPKGKKASDDTTKGN